MLAADLAKIKFLKSRKKPTLSDVLNFASLSLNAKITKWNEKKIKCQDFFFFLILWSNAKWWIVMSKKFNGVYVFL